MCLAHFHLNYREKWHTSICFRKVVKEEEKSWIEANTEERRDLTIFLDSLNADVINELDIIQIRQYIRSHDPTKELEDVLKQMLEARCQFDLSGSWNIVKAMRDSVLETSWKLLVDSLETIVEDYIYSL